MKHIMIEGNKFSYCLCQFENKGYPTEVSGFLKKKRTPQ
jgi:hypothetical protein